MRISLHAAALAAAVALSSPSHAAGTGADMAPLGLRTQGTLRELFLDVTAADARASSAILVDVRWSMANDWGMPTILQRGTTTLLQHIQGKPGAHSAAEDP